MRVRDQEEREIEQAVQDTILYANVAAHLNGPNSKPGEAVKAMPEETREHLRDTYMTRQLDK